MSLRAGRLLTALLSVALAAAVLLALDPLPAQAAAAETVGLHQAVAEGAVSYRFSGSGKTVGGVLTLVNNTDRALSVVVPTGTMFEPEDGKSQPMVTGRNPPIALNPGGTWTGPLVAFCTDHFKPPPRSGGEGSPIALGPRTAVTDEVTGLIIAGGQVKEGLASAPEREPGPWEERDPEGFWDTAMLWAVYAATQKIGQATYQETMENQLSEQISPPRAKQEARALGDEVFSAVHQIEDKKEEMKEDEVDLSTLDPTLKYRPPLEKPTAGSAVPAPGRPLLWSWGDALGALGAAFRPAEALAAEAAEGEPDLSKLNPTQKYRPPEEPPATAKPEDKPKAKVVDKGGAIGDVVPLATAFPTGPMVTAYLYMAASAHDQYRDLDAAHDWLDRALELDPYNTTATAMLDTVKSEEQQVGLQRMGVAMGVLMQMIEKAQEQEEQQQEEGMEEEMPPEEPP